MIKFCDFGSDKSEYTMFEIWINIGQYRGRRIDHFECFLIGITGLPFSYLIDSDELLNTRKWIKRRGEKCRETLMWCRDTTSRIEERSNEESYIFLGKNRPIESSGKGLKKWMMWLLRLKYPTPHDSTIFILHRHTVGDSTERHYVHIFLKNEFSFFWKKEIRKSLNHLPDYTRTRECWKRIERATPSRIHDGYTLGENFWTRMMISNDDIHSECRSMFYWFLIFCPTVDGNNQFRSCGSYLIHMVRLDTVSIVNTMRQPVRHIHTELISEEEKESCSRRNTIHIIISEYHHSLFFFSSKSYSLYCSLYIWEK